MTNGEKGLDDKFFDDSHVTFEEVNNAIRLLDVARSNDGEDTEQRYQDFINTMDKLREEIMQGRSTGLPGVDFMYSDKGQWATESISSRELIAIANTGLKIVSSLSNREGEFVLWGKMHESHYGGKSYRLALARLDAVSPELVINNKDWAYLNMRITPPMVISSDFFSNTPLLYGERRLPALANGEPSIHNVILAPIDVRDTRLDPPKTTTLLNPSPEDFDNDNEEGNIVIATGKKAGEILAFLGKQDALDAYPT